METQSWDFSLFSFSLASRFNDTPNVTIIGNNPTQKNHIIRELLGRVDDIPEPPLVFSGTGSFSKRFVPLELTDCIRNQNDQCNKYRKYHEYGKIKTGKEPDPRKIIIMDECFRDESWFRNKWVRSLYMMSRSWMLMSIITMNRPLPMSPVCRENVDYLFIFCDPAVNCDYKRRLWDIYAKVSILSYETFDSLYNDLAKTNAILVIDNRKREKINYVYEMNE